MIQINDDWRIKGDGNNVILEKRSTVQKGDNAGKEYWAADGFYPNVERAIKGCIDKRINVALDSEFWQVVKEYRAIMEELKGLSV